MLSLKNTLRARSEADRRFDQRLAEQLIPETPREIALDWLRERVREGRAGLDVYDPSVFILAANPNEITWAHRCVDLVGDERYAVKQSDGGQRIYSVLADDARRTLRLDEEGRWMTDEPLASRSVDHTDEQTRASMRLLLGGLDPERESTAALRSAHAAYEERQPS